MEVPARKRDGYEACEGPGDYFVTPPNPHEGGARRLSFLCPCGCRMLCGVKIRDDGGRQGGAWWWNHDEDKPTVWPSINIDHGHWHGYLIAGLFTTTPPKIAPNAINQE